jgi:antitoxin component YwqK of YwqJK toxin-antitoxin module
MRWIGTLGGFSCLAALLGLCSMPPRASLAEEAAADSVRAPVINPLRLGSRTRGKPAGRWVEWRGRAKWVGEYQDGKRHGVWEGVVPLTDGSHFAEPEYAGFAGPLSISVELHQNVPHGEMSAVDADQRPVFTWHFDQGVLEGKAIWWHPNGQVRRQATYRAGLLDGPVTQWNEDGSVTKQETYREGRASDAQIGWHDRGQKHYEGYSSLAGDVTRDAFDWLELRWSQTKVDEHLQEERCGRWTAWYPNGQKKLQGSYLENEAEGRFTWWHENGQKMAEGEFVSGNRHGVWRWWHANGRKQMEGEYQFGQVSGEWEAWSAEGTPVKVDRAKTALALDWEQTARRAGAAERIATVESFKPAAKSPPKASLSTTPAPGKTKSSAAAPVKKPPAMTTVAPPASNWAGNQSNAPRHQPGAASEFTLLGLLTGEFGQAGDAPPSQGPVKSPSRGGGSFSPKLSGGATRQPPRASSPPQPETPRNLIADLLGLEQAAPPGGASPRPVRR